MYLFCVIHKNCALNANSIPSNPKIIPSTGRLQIDADGQRFSRIASGGTHRATSGANTGIRTASSYGSYTATSAASKPSPGEEKLYTPAVCTERAKTASLLSLQPSRRNTLYPTRVSHTTFLLFSRPLFTRERHCESFELTNANLSRTVIEIHFLRRSR